MPFESIIIPTPSATETFFYFSHTIEWGLHLITTFVFFVVFLGLGLSGKLRDLCAKWGKTPPLTTILFLSIFFATGFALDVPFNFYEAYIQSPMCGYPGPPLSVWLRENTCVFAIGMGFGVPILMGVYAFLNHAPKRWWLYCTLLLMVTFFLLLFLSPIIFSSLFNSFQPLENRPLQTELHALATKSGISPPTLYVVDKHGDPCGMNAWVTGLSGTKRIVLSESILQKLSLPEIQFIIAHELGHYVSKYLVFMTIWITLNLGIFFYALYKSSSFLITIFGRQMGFSSISDIASAPLLMILCISYGLLVLPVTLAYSRYQERKADLFAIQLTRNPMAASTALIKLFDATLEYPSPGPIFMLFQADHPSLKQRLSYLKASTKNKDKN